MHLEFCLYYGHLSCATEAQSCGINLKQWRNSEIQRNHKKTTLLLLSSPLPPPLFIHRKERYCFPSNPPPHQTLSLSHTRTRACTHQGLSRAALRSCRSEDGRKERWGLMHTALVVSLTTQTPDKTTTDRRCAA